MRFSSLEINKFLMFVVVAFVAFGPAFAAANVESAMISGAQIKQKVASFLASKNLVGKPAISEKRLFPACASEISVRPLFGGMKTVEISCPDTGGFKIAVRTNASKINAKGFLANNPSRDAKKSSLVGDEKDQVFLENGLETTEEMHLVMARSVQKGQVLSHDDVTLKVVKIKNRRDYFNKVSDAVGRKVKKKLSINQVLLNRHLEIDWDILEGQKVIIQSTVGPVEVESGGISKENAQIGELVQAKNQQSGKLIEGIVVSQKKIKVLTK